MLVAGCAGDFGRPRAVLFGDDSVVGLPQGLIEPTASRFPFTDDEQRMRELGYPLLLPPDVVTSPLAVGPVDFSYAAVMADHSPSFDTAAYGRKLMTMWVASETSRYSRLIDDVRDDMIHVSRFYETARRVVDMDRKRERSLEFVAGLTAGERNDALARNSENTEIINRVGDRLHARVACYRYALQRLAMAVPSPLAAQADRALLALEGRIRPLDAAPAPAGSLDRVVN